MAVDDAELVARALGGSQDAYRDLLTRYQRPVYALLVRLVRDPALAEDLAQEAFLKVFRSLSSFAQDRRFSSWVLKIAHNTALDHLRRQSPRLESLTAAEEDERSLLDTLADPRAESPEAARGRGELRQVLEGAIAGLRPEYRAVLLLRHQEERSYEEIAEIVGLPLGTVKTHLHRARRALGAAMAAQGWGPPGETPAAAKT